MKILIYSMNFWPEPTSTGKYSGEMAVWLAARGHDVRVIAAPPYYPEWKVADGYSAFRYRKDVHAGVDIRRCPVWIPQRPNGWKRILCMLLFAISCLWEAAKSLIWRPDMVMVVEPPISCAPVAWLFAKLGGAKTWLHIQDFEVDAATQLGMLKRSFLKRMALWGERCLIRRFDRCSTISNRMLDKLTAKCGDDRRNVLFPNWVDCEEVFPIARSSFRDSLKIAAGRKVAMYAGNIGKKQGLEILIESARLLKDRQDLIFVICGNGAAFQHIRAMGNGLANIIWLPVQPTELLNDLLALADVHLLPQVAGAADLVMPSKLTGMLASGRPVLATADPGTQVYDLVCRIGKVVPPERPDVFAAALTDMLEYPELLIQMGQEARRIAEETLSREAILLSFEKELLGCVGDSRREPGMKVNGAVRPNQDRHISLR